jgi:DNA-binding transcriptional LysR family regulator
MEILHARVFSALVFEGSMTGAGIRLGVSQPAISSALGVLEKELGIILFNRTRRGLTLTPKGELLLPKMRALLETAEEIESFGGGTSAEEGTLRVAGRQGFMQYVFPALLKQLDRSYPGIRVEQAISGDQDEVISALRTGRADIAFAASPKIKSISAEIFFQDPVMLAVSRTHPLAKKRIVSLKDISSLPLCLPASGDRLRSPINAFLRKLPRTPKVVIETNDYTLMKNLIANEGCAGFIYAHTLPVNKNDSEILPLRIREFDIKRELTILHRRDDAPPHVGTARKVFIAEAKRTLGAILRSYSLDTP